MDVSNDFDPNCAAGFFLCLPKVKEKNALVIVEDNCKASDLGVVLDVTDTNFRIETEVLNYKLCKCIF